MTPSPFLERTHILNVPSVIITNAKAKKRLHESQFVPHSLHISGKTNTKVKVKMLTPSWHHIFYNRKISNNSKNLMERAKVD